MSYEHWHHSIGMGVIAAGVVQILLVVASPAIRVALKWRERFRSMRPCTRQIFWTYAAYLLATNLFFGLIALFGHGLLLDGSALAKALCGFMAAWWVARTGFQFHYFEPRGASKGTPASVGPEALVIGAFAALAVVFSAAFLFNLLPPC